jgi:SAM-dependent methyltransferase
MCIMLRSEGLKPISVKPPSQNPFVFAIRCIFDLQLATIVKYLRPSMLRLKGRVLDVGAGESPWREWLPQGCTYQGIEVENSRDFGISDNRSDIVYYDGKNIPFPSSSFDGVICIEVLEHVEFPDQFLHEISRVMKPEATLLLTVPWSARHHHRPHDFYRFTKEQLRILLVRNGFPYPEIYERGNEISAIASKLVVLTIRLLKPLRINDAIWSVPIGVIVGTVAIVALVSAHVSEMMGSGSKDDPLGFFVRASCFGE